MRLKVKLLDALCVLSCLLAAALPAAGQGTARYAHTTTLLPNGNVLIVGGLTADGAGNATSSVEIDISTDGLAGFQTADPLDTARASHTATLLPDGRVLIAGGMDAAGVVLNNVQVYDPRTNTMQAEITGGMQSARYNHTATLLPDGTVMIAGGQTDNGVPNTTTSNTCDIFDPTLNGGLGAFAAAGTCNNFGLARAGHTASLIHDGRIMIAGGYLTRNGGPINDFGVSTEFYDFATGIWTPGPSLIAKRAFHTATQLGNTKVLIAGGFNARDSEANRGFLDTTEIYDPISNTITPGEKMIGRKMWHTSTVSPDGIAHIGGGLGNVTTTYTQITEAIEDGSRVCLGNTNLTAYRAEVTVGPCGSDAVNTNISFLLQETLSDPVSGRIIDGEVDYSSTIISMATGRFSFSSNPLTSTVLDGTDVSAGFFSGIYSFDSPLTGDFLSIPQNLTSVSNAIADNSLFTSIAGGANTVAAGESTVIDSGTIIMDVVFGMPAETFKGDPLIGEARIRAVTIVRAIDELVLSFDAELTSGTASFSQAGNECQPVTFDIIDGFQMACTLTFAGVAGIITNTTEQAITTANLDDLDGSGGDPLEPKVEIQTVEILSRFILDRYDLGQHEFKTDGATIVVREMHFGDDAKYSPITNTWEFGIPMTSPVMNHTTLLMNNGDRPKYGGRACVGQADCTARTYTANTGPQIHVPFSEDFFTLSASLNTPRSKHAATLMTDGSIIVSGGVQGANPINSVERYDPEIDLFQNIAPMSVARSLHSTTLLPNGRILAAGGFTSASSTGATNTAEIYYPEIDRWLMTDSMSSSRTFHTTIMLPDGNVMVMGGIANGQFLNTAEIYYSTARVWKQIPSMDTKRAQHTAALLHDGRVLVVGGANVSGILGGSQSNGITGSEIYDPAIGQWLAANTVPVMTTPRHSHTMTLLRDGRALVAGGNDGFGEIGEGEVYDPVANTWTEIDPTDTTRDMVIPRISHTALLLPNGKVFFHGGFTSFGPAIAFAEGFDVDFTTWQVQGRFNNSRGHHTATLLKDGTIMLVGGTDGAQDEAETEVTQFNGGIQDAFSNSGGSLREPTIVSLDTGTVQRGLNLTINGAHFKGVTEAGSGPTGSSAHSHPRVYLRRLDGHGGNSNNSSGFVVDLTTYIVNGTDLFGAADVKAKWAQLDSSITFTVPLEEGITPYGNYHLYVANNGQFSEGQLLKIGPAVPSGSISVPTGSLVGVSSVSWQWDGSNVGTHDGYNIYNSSDGVWIATIPASNSTAVTYVQRGLGTDESALIQVAPFTISGDGEVVSATVPVNTLNAGVVGLNGVAKTTGSIQWSWAANSAANQYNIYNATTGALIASTPTITFIQTGLSTNTANSVQVRAVTEAGLGPLTGSTTIFTLAAVPIPGVPPLQKISTGGFVIVWDENTNPDGTTYTLEHSHDLTVTTTVITDITETEVTLSGEFPNAFFDLIRVAAVNGDGVESSFVSMGSTSTLAETPANLIVADASPDTLELQWTANGNPSTTTYQIVISTDGFSTHFSTVVAFSDGLRDTTKVLTGLFTGLTYDIRLFAANRFGNATAFVSTSGFTDNGGASPGSLAVTVHPNQFTSLVGNLSNGRSMELSIQAGTFLEPVQIFISHEPVLNCGSINAAVTLTAVPNRQPLKPFWMSMSYTSGEVSASVVNSVAMTRFDPTGNSCVPLETSLDKINTKVTSKINHLSTFQLASITGATTVDNARIFPNPIYTSRSDAFVTFDRLPTNAIVTVFTLNGHEVFQGTANRNGMLTWDVTNNAGRALASGIYIVRVEGSGSEKLLKLAVVR